MAGPADLGLLVRQGWAFDSKTGYYYTGSGCYDPASGQTIGCHDKGMYDPGEDICGEDENPACHRVVIARWSASGAPYGPGIEPCMLSRRERWECPWKSKCTVESMPDAHHTHRPMDRI
ncbi:MAG: hypothetical protein ACRDFX_07890 [Chloroflexota bacterium]